MFIVADLFLVIQVIQVIISASNKPEGGYEFGCVYLRECFMYVCNQ